MKNVSDKDFESAIRYMEIASGVLRRQGNNKMYNIGRMMILMTNRWEKKM